MLRNVAPADRGFQVAKATVGVHFVQVVHVEPSIKARVDQLQPVRLVEEKRHCKQARTPRLGPVLGVLAAS